jgi:hypothetical protein
MSTDPNQVTLTCMNLILRDEPWRNMGFRRQPKYGRLINKYFRPPWRVDFERAVRKEMLILFTAVHIASGVMEKDQLEAMIRIYVAGTDGGAELWRHLFYESRTEAENHIRDSVAIYLDSGIHEWPGILTDRLGTMKLPTRKLVGTFTLGAINFAQYAQNMIVHLRATAEPFARV